MKPIHILIGSALFLSVCGMIAVYSTDPLRESGFGISSFYGRQIVWGILSWLIFIVIGRVDYHWFLKIKWPVYLFILLSLAAVLMFGSGEESGARRWLFSRSVQPSELAKIGYILFIVAFLPRQISRGEEWELFFKLGILTLIPGLLIFVQPDLGTSLVLIAVWFCGMIVSGFHWKKIILSMAVLMALVPASWPFLADYQKNRLISFIDPYQDPLGTGYNVLQSQIAIGTGGFLGNGLLSGPQSQLRFLPARSTDFIFAAWCEQLGFLGGAIIIVFFMILIWAVMHIAREARDIEGKYLATLIAVMFVFQIVINIGMNMGVMPVTGLPLPFISYGGSSLMINLISLGLVSNIYRFTQTEEKGF